MKKITIVSLIAVFFVGCNGGGINLSELGKEFHNLVESLPEPPSKGSSSKKLTNNNSGKICAKTQLGCDMAYAIQKLPEEERLSCEWNYCVDNSLQLSAMSGDFSYGVQKDKVCKASKKRYEQIEREVIKKLKAQGIHSFYESKWSNKYELAEKIKEPLYKFEDLCRYKIEDMPIDEYAYRPYIFLD